jgi:hypothetical protein
LFFFVLFAFIDGKKIIENAVNEMRDKRGLDSGFGYGDFTAAYNPTFWAGYENVLQIQVILWNVLRARLKPLLTKPQNL